MEIGGEIFGRFADFSETPCNEMGKGTPSEWPDMTVSLQGKGKGR